MSSLVSFGYVAGPGTSGQFSQVTAVQGEIAAYGNPLYQCDSNAVYVLLNDGYSIQRLGTNRVSAAGSSRYLVPSGMRTDRYDPSNKIINSVLVVNP